MNKKKLIVVLFLFLILNYSSINFHILKNKQAELDFLSYIYRNSSGDKPILIMSNDKIENITYNGEKEFIIYSEAQVDRMLTSPEIQVFYKTLDVTIILNIAIIKNESYRAFNQSGVTIHALCGGGKYYAVNIFGHWFIRNFGMFSVNY